MAHYSRCQLVEGSGLCDDHRNRGIACINESEARQPIVDTTHNTRPTSKRRAMGRRWCLIVGMGLMLAGCGSPMKSIKTDFYNGAYLQAAEQLVQRLDTHRSQIDSFMQANGAALIERLDQEGRALSYPQPTKKTLLFYDAYVSVLTHLHDHKIALHIVSDALDRATDNRQKSITTVCQFRYERAKHRERNGLLRGAIEDLELIQAYQPEAYPEINTQLPEWIRRASRVIVVHPVSLRDEHWTMNPLIPVDKTSPAVQAEAIQTELTDHIRRTLNLKKSRYITIATPNQAQPVTPSHYRVQIAMSLTHDMVIGTNKVVHDSLRYSRLYNGVVSWHDQVFSYNTHQRGYQVTITAEIEGVQTQTNQTVLFNELTETYHRHITFAEKTAEAPITYKEIHYPMAYLEALNQSIYIDREAVIDEMIDDTSDTIASIILTQLDRERDQYIDSAQ